ncbi:hypothetical protein ROJ8625_00513 [Roseivivax jejudonensis]|uniref:DUF3995 domain-containing protein n=1 Tax=Roseivivax jejudonensis TaxID=1529041 RepID=A0A1X6YAY0_9RHOB|nr:DUF3995 domain-containing protein [Roseivivax jejudonensis]SLN15744.1 hypothetical protein ROJ8625_00513 [Roseivivax jejudonensis]
MTALGWITCAVLVVLAALHLLWAIGYWVPVRDETRLARTVYGLDGVTRMPGAVPCALAAVAFFFLAILPALAWFPLRSALLTLAGAAMLARAGAAYLPAVRRLAPEEPFATLDRRVYGPLWAALGAAFLVHGTGG